MTSAAPVLASASVGAVLLPACLMSLGAMLVTRAATGIAVRRGAAQPRRNGPATGLRTASWWWRVLLGLLVTLAVWAVTGWPVAGIWMGLLSGWVPSLGVKGRQRREEMAVAAGVARLAGMMRDQVLVGADVAEAIRGCVPMAPVSVAAATERMAERLQFEEPGVVLAGFADQVDDPMAELLAASLRFALTRRTAKLADLFDEVARATDEQVRMRRSIEKERRRLRTAMWSVMVAVLAWLVVIYGLSGTYLAPYDGLSGQGILALAGGAFAAGLLGLAKMDQIGGPGRLHLRAEEAA